MRGIFDEGTLTLVWGTMGSGKTDYSWLIDKRATDLGMKILTNKKDVKCHKKVINYDRIESDIHFFNLFLKYRRNLLTGLDEANLWQSSKDAFQDQEKQLERFVSIIRHFRSALYVVIQRKSNLLPMLRELRTWEIKKITQKMYYAKNSKGEEAFYTDTPTIKDYNVNFKTYTFSNFKFYLNIKKLVKQISEGKDYNEQLEILQTIARKNFEGFRLEQEGKG